MKKIIFSLISAIIVGFLFGKFMFSQYDYKSNIKTVFNEKNEKVYFIQQGVYSSIESMEKNVTDFTHYIYDEIDGKYYVYVGITKLDENVSKLKDYFKNMGYIIYVKEFNVDNSEFLKALETHDELLLQTTDSKAIKTIQNQILSKYEELISNAKNTN